MKVYIAGRITGVKNYAEQFRKAENWLLENGHIPLNPATMPEGMEKADYMRICLAMLDSADEAWFLPGWIHSKGAKLEAECCKYTEKPCRYFQEME